MSLTLLRYPLGDDDEIRFLTQSLFRQLNNDDDQNILPHHEDADNMAMHDGVYMYVRVSAATGNENNQHHQVSIVPTHTHSF